MRAEICFFDDSSLSKFYVARHNKCLLRYTRTQRVIRVRTKRFDFKYNSKTYRCKRPEETQRCLQ